MDYTVLLELIKNQLSKRRFEHTMRTVKAAELLAERFSCNMEDVRTAVLWHDYAKEWTHDKILDAVQHTEAVNFFNIREEEKKIPDILHGAAAAIELNRLFPHTKIKPEILSAIRWHTAGSPDMGQLGYIVFIADYIEDGRKHLTENDRQKITDKENLETMMLVILKREFSVLAKKHLSIMQSSKALYQKLSLEQNRV